MKLSKSQKLVYEMEKYAGGSISVICGSMVYDRAIDADVMQRYVNELYRLNAALRIRSSDTGSSAELYLTDIISYSVRDGSM